MSKEQPYLVGKLSYAPWNQESPWHIVRYGEIIDQGGSHLGSEHMEFKHLEDALHYLELATLRDLESINNVISTLREDQVEALPND